MRSTLIYDSDCPYCIGIAKIVSMSKRFRITSYNSELAQQLLEEEFDDPGFTFYLFEKDKIYYGDHAAKRTAERLYRSKTLGGLFYRLYPSLSKFFTVLSRRTGVKNPECSGDRCLIQSDTGGVVKRKK